MFKNKNDNIFRGVYQPKICEFKNIFGFQCKTRVIKNPNIFGSDRYCDKCILKYSVREKLIPERYINLMNNSVQDYIDNLDDNLDDNVNNNINQNQNNNNINQNNNIDQNNNNNNNLDLKGDDEKTEISELQCVVCLDNKKTVQLNCNHVCLCIKCSTDLRQDKNKAKCPICRADIKTVTKIYI